MKSRSPFPKNTLFLLLTSLFMNGVALASGDPETLVRDGYDEKQMDAAIARARSETGAFLKILEKGDADSFCVKAPVTQGEEVEHFWLVNIRFEDGYFIGEIGNEPGIVDNVRFGQEWKIKREEISDWMYVRSGKIYGGYTIDLLLPTMKPEEAAALRDQLVR